MDIALDSCRICLKTMNLENIFGEMCGLGEVPIWEKIVYCASVQVYDGDSLPKMICKQCLDYLNIAYIFKSICVATDEKLRNLHYTTDFQQTECHPNDRHCNDLIYDDNENIADVSGKQKNYKETITEPEESKKIVSNVKINKLDVTVSSSNDYEIEHNCYDDSIINKYKISNDNDFNANVNNEGQEKQVVSINHDFKKNAPKDIFKVGRHIAKKNSGKYPQKLYNKSMNGEKLDIKDNVFNDTILLNDVNFGKKNHMDYNFEDIPENDIPVVAFEETVISDETFSFSIQTDNSQITELIPFEQTNENKNTRDSDILIMNSGKKSDKNGLTKVKLKLSPMKVRCGNRKVNVFNDHHIEVTKVRQNKDLVKNLKDDSRKKRDCFKCDVCSKVFPFRSHLDRHLSMHTGIKKYSCSYCGQKFINSYNLSVHILKHTGEFPLQCEICNKGFPNPSLLRRHQICHTSEVKFQCRYCPVKFTQSSSLKLHEKMHLHRPSYHCDVCYKVFSYTNSLAAHRKQHFSTKRFTCDTCLSTFSRKSSLIRHMEVHYKAQKSFNCKLCSAIFNNKDIYYTHLKVHLNRYK